MVFGPFSGLLPGAMQTALSKTGCMASHVCGGGSVLALLRCGGLLIGVCPLQPKQTDPPSAPIELAHLTALGERGGGRAAVEDEERSVVEG